MNKTFITLLTIGFSGSQAENFFNRLKTAHVKKVIDTRRWPSSQLSGFARSQDLPYFLSNLIGCDYVYREDMAPSDEILRAYKNGVINWDEYKHRYLCLLENRKIIETLDPRDLDRCCFLCAEAKADHCHRRLLAEYLADIWLRSGTQVVIRHL